MTIVSDILTGLMSDLKAHIIIFPRTLAKLKLLFLVMYRVILPNIGKAHEMRNIGVKDI